MDEKNKIPTNKMTKPLKEPKINIYIKVYIYNEELLWILIVKYLMTIYFYYLIQK